MGASFSKKQFDELGFQVLENIYNQSEVDSIINCIDNLQLKEAFGVREFLQLSPKLQNLLFTPKLVTLIKEISPTCSRSIKSIYFDKPPSSNWIVNWHQDLTINLKNKVDFEGFKNWRVKTERTIVQPSLEMLHSIFTIRIHLDDCTKHNGAVRVIPGSHKNGVIDISSWVKENHKIGEFCEVKKGGVMLMKPLTLHASRRSENNEKRRVIHLEFTDKELPKGMEWKEGLVF